MFQTGSNFVEGAAFLTVFAIGELIALFLFRWLRGALPGSRPEGAWFDVETLKGMLERGMLLFGLALGFAHILTVFAAIKLANRIAEEGPDDDEQKNYFLIGNVCSIILVFTMYTAAKGLTG